MSQFDKFNNTTNTYIPDNTSLRIKDKNKELDLNLPKKDYNLKGDFISYSWNKGDTLSLKFSVNKEITVENNALIFEISGESPSFTEGYLHQRAYNLVDIKSWTCNAISEEFGSSWIEDKVFTYPSIGSVTHLIPDMNGKSLLGEILNFRQEVIYAQQFDNVNEAEIEINKELSEKLTTGIYYCRASVVTENTSYMYKQYMIHVTVADDGEEKKLDVCEYERVVPNNSDIIVDSELSPVSLNPVQNKVIYHALQNLGAVKSISINGEELYFPDEFGNIDLEIKSPAYKNINDIDEYFYEIDYEELDYPFAKEYYKTHNTYVPTSCSSIINGNFFGRSYDFIYNENASFLVNVLPNTGRYASIGMGNIEGLTDEKVKNREKSELYKILPFHVVDGINEHGLTMSANVVPIDKGLHTKTVPYEYEREEICSLMLIRYVLDRFTNAQEAVEYIKNYVSVYFPKDFIEMGYEEHFLIADENNNYYVLEAIIDDDGISRLETYDFSYMTNFHLDGVTLNEDGSVYTPETQTSTENAEVTNGITSHGCGLERYNLINNLYNTIESKDDMRNLLNNLIYTHSYKKDVNPIWWTEFVGLDNLTVISPVSNYENSKLIKDVIYGYEHRSRDPQSPYYGTWWTVHNTIYDINNRTAYVTVQEKETEYQFSIDISNALWTRGEGTNSLIVKGNSNESKGDYSLAEGYATKASGDVSHTEGYKTKTGNEVIDIETIPVEEQVNTKFGPAHAEGFVTIAKPLGSHSEGYKTQAIGFASHAEGNSSQAKGINSHAEGVLSETSPPTGSGAIPEWRDGYAAHAEGHLTTAGGRASHTEGDNTVTNNPSEHAEGRYNISHFVDGSTYGNAGNTQHSIGIGNSQFDRKNAFEIMENGDAYLIGVGDYDGTNPSDSTTIQNKLNDIPIEGVDYLNPEQIKILSDLVNYYTKSETYTKDEVDELISVIKQFSYLLVDELPTASAETMYKIYLVPSEESKEQNTKDEFITIKENNIYKWEQIGSTAIDLTGYATENWVSLNFTSNNDFAQAISDVQSEIDNIDEKIPTQASSSNQLADKNFVNSSIENVAAFYITKDALGNPFISKAELDNATVYYSGGAIRVPTRNDYVIVQYDESKMSTETGEKPTTRYLYDNGWNFQYIVNNSGLTAAQLVTLNSGLTSEDKDTIDDIPDMYYNKIQVDNLLDDKQDTLISGENIKTINSQSILGEGNIDIKTYSPFPDDFITDGTLEQVADSMVSSTGAIKGMAYLGQIEGDCLPFDGVIAECKVEFMADGLALLTVSSSDIIPYHWEYNTYAGDYIWKRFSYVLPNPTNVGSQDLTSIEIDGEIFNIKTEVDQEYDSTSINAQSGVAVAQALQTVSIDTYTEEEIDTLWDEVEE